MFLPRPWAILAATLVAITVLFGVSADYAPPLHDAIVAILLIAGVLSAWFAGARAIVGADEPRRLRAAAGALLVAPFVLFSLLLGVGPPHVQPPQQNDLRFVVLAIDAMLVAAGLFVLKEALADAGERFNATLGLAAAALACPLYVGFALIQHIDYAAVEIGWSWAASVDGTRRELTPLDALSMATLFFGGALTYIATAAFARALARVGWLGRAAATAFQIIAALALAFLIARGFAYPTLQAAFSHWTTIPGFVAGIPAVPWMPLAAIGVLLLRGCDREPALSARAVSAPARSAATSARP